MPKLLSKSLRSLRRLRRRLQLSNLFGSKRRTSTAVLALSPFSGQKRACPTAEKSTPLSSKRLRKEHNASPCYAVDVVEVLTETPPNKPPLAPETVPGEFVE